MVKMSQREQLEKMEDGMAKQILTKILNTPKPDYEKMEREIEEAERYRWEHMSEEMRMQYAALRKR